MLLMFYTLDMNDNEKRKFEEIYYLYRNLLFGIAKNIVNNTQDAEDVLQNVFLKVSQNMCCIEDVHSTKTKSFLIVITKNSAFDMNRKKKKVIY